MYGTFGVEMTAYGQQLVRNWSNFAHTQVTVTVFKTSRHSKLLFFVNKTKDNGTQKAVQRYGVGKLLYEKNLRDVWCRNESVRAEIGQLLQTHRHTHASKLVVEISVWSTNSHPPTLNYFPPNTLGFKSCRLHVNMGPLFSLSQSIDIYIYIYIHYRYGYEWT